MPWLFFERAYLAPNHTEVTTNTSLTSSVMWPFDTPRAISYRCSVVTEAVSPTVFEIFGYKTPVRTHTHTHTHTRRKWFYILSHAMYCIGQTINNSGLNLKFHHGAIADNVVTNLCAKFDDDRLWNEKALVLIRTRTKEKRKRTFVALGNPFPGLKMFNFLNLKSSAWNNSSELEVRPNRSADSV